MLIFFTSFAFLAGCVVSRKILAVLDFDHTIVEANSISIFDQLIPIHLRPKSSKMLYNTERSFVPYTNLFYKRVYELNITAEQITDLIGNIPPIKDMDRLIDYLSFNGCEIIIISNSFTIFVSKWLQAKSLSNAVTNIYSNPSWFNEVGMLIVKAYHNQSVCRRSHSNLCKRIVLSMFLDKQKNRDVCYDNIIYVGDGKNDICAVTLLKEHDFVFARAGYKLSIQLRTQFVTNATIYSWVEGFDIIHVITEKLGFNVSEYEQIFNGSLVRNNSNYYVNNTINLENCMTKPLIQS